MASRPALKSHRTVLLCSARASPQLLLILGMALKLESEVGGFARTGHHNWDLPTLGAVLIASGLRPGPRGFTEASTKPRAC